MKEKEVKIELPEEIYTLINWHEDGLPGVGVLNSSLKDFEHQYIFSWHLTVVIYFEELIENGMPSIEEREIVDPFGDKLEKDIKAGGNALFLIRETWNGTRSLIWRVYDPEIADQHLKNINKYNQYPRQFNWHMSQDLNWEKAQWHFDQLENNNQDKVH
ncbi:DUF695 domain-containing protein [Marinicella gelatinilytica]|uniref:DUF695 domain-containing protein n=1 Tax=Marinicella gelatinilytica TaxID=2996017 RepID=UPI00226084A3|nr:DUF695 domain-containing protein [Marinicella gelatinilytica]MCX7545013.1 DUF695 domain-containing protein [Marinicella gelatinilytica]